MNIKSIFSIDEEVEETTEENYYLRHDILLYEPKDFNDAQDMATSFKTR